MEYVVGFLYDNDEKLVALIRKLKPIWQRNKLNGIGGKIEIGETPDQAIIREFKEETGVEINNWRKFCELNGDDFKVYFYSAKGDLSKLRSMEEEKVEICSISLVSMLPVIPNLNWLIPLGIDQYNTGGYLFENIKF